MFVAHRMLFYTGVAPLNMLAMKSLSLLIHRLVTPKVYEQTAQFIPCMGDHECP